ncbi:ribokinase [Nakamurella antarctica]|uniref:Ribokinase n=1 Tax=Nakamurella antarctica TaxID=1902245 RepID=A0A3G8ZKN0_9ACTN|nr:ribokinase [Nakamurella antarctica]AZI57337.1 ribokinase [Nakamurella antarctica]
MTTPPPTAPAIAVVGSVNMDLVVTTDALPEPGETLLGNSFQTIPGGKGSNQAIAAAKAGGAVTFIGAVGSDGFAAELRSNLHAAGVDCSLLRTAPGPSGIAAIAVNKSAENTIVVVPGANFAMTSLADSDTAAIASSAMLVCQLEIPMTTVVAAAQAAQTAGVPVLLNPSPMQNLSAELLAATTILIVNEGEAREIGSAADHVAHVIVTLGGAGARYRGPDGAAFQVPVPDIDPIDTTGAGDGFAGAFAVAWAEGQSPLQAVRFACCAGALATTVRGASTSSPLRADIDRLVSLTY